eukprot:scaffold3403_cov158-Amphora_coffeaeformis.AAC.3
MTAKKDSDANTDAANMRPRLFYNNHHQVVCRVVAMSNNKSLWCLLLRVWPSPARAPMTPKI